MNYNATAYKMDSEGRTISVQAVEVNENGLVVRAAGYWSHRVGTEAYDADWRGTFFSNVAEVRIEPGTRGYMERIARMMGSEELVA